jgi:very-short-patch-repair endonuclease
MRSEQPDIAIDRIAGVQHGIVTRAQLVAIGLSARAIDRRVASGRLTRIFHGVYRAGPIAGARARETAACLACGSDAVLSHRTAGGLWEVDGAAGGGSRSLAPAREAPVVETPAVEVSVPHAVRRRISGIIAHRVRDLGRGDVAEVEGLPVTAPARTLFDLATVVPLRDLERAIAIADRKRLLSPADLLRRAEASLRHRGARIIRKLLAAEAVPAFTRSEAESRMLHLIRLARLRRPQVNVQVCGYEVDFFWPDERLVVEVDGYAWHASSAAFARDRRRDADLHASGIRVIRFTWDDVTKHPEATIAVLAAALARG